MAQRFWKRFRWRLALPSRWKAIAPWILTIAMTLVILGTAPRVPVIAAASVPPSSVLLAQRDNADTTDLLATDPSPQNHRNWVVLGGKELFPIEASAGLKNREERAKEVSTNLRMIADERSISLDDIQIRNKPELGTAEIYANGQSIFTIYEADAEAADVSRAEVAEEYLTIIRQGIEHYRDVYSPRSTLWGLGKTAIATLALVLGFVLLKRLSMALQIRLWTFQSTYVRSIRIGSREIVQADQISGAIVQIAQFLRLFLILGILGVYINAILGFFPQTRSISTSIFSSISSVLGQFLQGIFSYIPSLIFLVLLAVIALYILKFTRFIFREIEQGDISVPGFDQEWALPTSRIAQLLVVAFFAVVAFPYLPGAGSQAFQGISLFLGLLISLGSSSAIANIVAGILLTYTRAFKIGDDVEISGVSGTVVEKGLVVTRLLTFRNLYVSIPNAEVLGTNVINYRRNYQPDEGNPPIIHIQVGFDYELPWQKAHEILLTAAYKNEHILQDPAPWVAHVAFEDDGVLYELNAYTDNPGPSGGYHISSALRRHIQEHCEKANIQLERIHKIAMETANGPVTFVKQ